MQNQMQITHVLIINFTTLLDVVSQQYCIVVTIKFL